MAESMEDSALRERIMALEIENERLRAALAAGLQAHPASLASRSDESLGGVERRQAYLLQLSDAIGAMATVADIQAVAARLLGEHLRADRVTFIDVDARNGASTLGGAWDLAGETVEGGGLSPAGWPVSRLADGRSWAVADAAAEPALSDAQRAACRGQGIGARIIVPQVDNGRLVAACLVDQRAPRAWTPAELRIAEETAARSWAAVRRARAEAELHEARERYLGVYEAIDQGFCILRVAFDAADNALDYQFVEVSPAFEAQTGLKDAGGRWMRDLAPDQDQHWFDLYGRVALTGEPLRFEAGSVPLGRWWSVYAYRVGAPAERKIAVLFADVTERKRTEAALRESEERFRIIVESARDYAIFVTDVDRNIVTWPAGAEAVFGWSAAEITCQSADLLWTEEDRAARQPQVEAAEAAQRGYAPNIRWHVRKDGSRVFIEGSVRPLRDTGGELRGFLKIGQDVTERRRTEEALSDSEARFRGFAENSADVLWIMNPAGTALDYLSPSFDAMYGEPRERVMEDLGRFMTLVHPEDRSMLADFLPRAMGGEIAVAHYRVIRPSDGKTTYLRDTGFPIRDASGAIARVAGIVQDVNDIAQANAAQEAEKERFRTLVEGIPQLVWRSAAHGHWTWASPQWTAFTGQPTEDSHGRGWLDAVHPEDRDRAIAAWERAGTAGIFETDFRLYQAGGQVFRWFQSRGLPVRGKPEPGFPLGRVLEWLGTTTDVDEQVRAREALARNTEELEARVQERTAELMAAEESLRQSQKMEAIGQLTGGIAHDFNNMLQGVVGGLEMARRRLEEGRQADTTRYLVAAREAAGRAAGLTRRLLAFARRQRLEPRALDANALVSGMAELVRRTIGPGIALELGLGEGQWRVHCDPGELESALLNLCINARDAMPSGGRLTIDTHALRLSRADLRETQDAEPGDYVAITVQDTGIGIPADLLDRVVEPFFTTKPQGQGTGLGLSQVWGFARQSGGLLRIESMPGQGTRVRILLPRGHDEPAGADIAPAMPDWETGDATGTVLLVDDETAARIPAAEHLRDRGYRVVEAPDGPTALRLLDSGIRPDLLITDMGLPGGMNGRQVAEVTRERIPGLPVLFITGYAGTSLPPGTEVIGKPFDLDDLTQRVQSRLAAERSGDTAAEP
ncbi:MAG: PAS domain S-box protein [Pseudomonadota bacterium]